MEEEAGIPKRKILKKFLIYSIIIVSIIIISYLSYLFIKARILKQIGDFTDDSFLDSIKRSIGVAGSNDTNTSIPPSRRISLGGSGGNGGGHQGNRKTENNDFNWHQLLSGKWKIG